MQAGQAVLHRFPPKFTLGDTRVAPRALDLLGRPALDYLLARHAAGDWGNVSSLRAKANALALDQGYFLLSQYDVQRALIYVLTDDDRMHTAVFAVEME